MLISEVSRVTISVVKSPRIFLVSDICTVFPLMSYTNFFFNKHFWKDVTYYVFRSKVNQSKTSFRAPCMSMVTKGERAKVKMALSEHHT